eukprot:GHVU01042420.1.p2 GENE.GHVU01042420.1~~GHVU01042420.1.p2  ORF type:complete len:113 (-),score=8.16 GHVU01042420.1:873-1211(-)
MYNFPICLVFYVILRRRLHLLDVGAEMVPRTPRGSARGECEDVRKSLTAEEGTPGLLATPATVTAGSSESAEGVDAVDEVYAINEVHEADAVDAVPLLVDIDDPVPDLEEGN